MNDSRAVWNVLRWYHDGSVGSITGPWNGITFDEVVVVRRGLAFAGQYDIAIVRDDCLWKYMTQRLDIFQALEGGGPSCARGSCSILRSEPSRAPTCLYETSTSVDVCRQPS